METIKSSDLMTILIPLLVMLFIIAVGVVLLYQHFQKNLFIHKLKQETMKSSHQNELLRANIQAQEEERKRIAQDIHDELGATLSIMRMNMLMLERDETTPVLLPRLQNLRTLTESAFASMRSISHRLMPPQLQAFGLIKTLEAVITQINQSGTIHIQLQASTDLADIPWAVSLGLYRVLMELINNTIKHSGASNAHITISEDDNQIICRFTDNGAGMPSDNQNKGLGHKNIEGRISALGGTFELSAPEGNGFCAIMHIPLLHPATGARPNI